jgi:2,3-bisphosphoglycerate-independent phosphoglycerate mutase
MKMERGLELVSRLSRPNEAKILLIILDGLGGLYHPEFGGKTELQYANLPHLDRFVQHKRTVTGLIYPVRRGIIPGSGPGHLGLFGYDPLFYNVGRGALEAAVFLKHGEISGDDIVARFNFCTVDENRIVTDRRAGRLTNGAEFALLLNKEIPEIKGTKVKVISTKEHRGVFVIKNRVKLNPNITYTDPEEVGEKILEAKPISIAKLVGGTGDESESRAAEQTAKLVNIYTSKALEVLKNRKPANGIIFRGFSTFPNLPQFNTVYSVNAAAIATHPLYKGIAQLVGMTVLGEPTNFEEEVKILNENYDGFDFFFLHYKDPDSRGEDKDFLGKVKALEYFDNLLSRIISKDKKEFDAGKFKFDVIAITGDHSTPSYIGTHTHHSVPLAIYSDFMKGFDTTEHFDEAECTRGILGRILGVELMTILLANGKKLRKFEGFV